MMHRPRARTLATFAAVSVALSAASGSAQARTLRIGIVEDGPPSGRARARAVVVHEIEEVLAGDFEVEFPPEARAQGEWTVESVDRALDAVLARRDVDLVLAVGLLASHRAGQRDRLPVPVVATFVVDPQLQGLPVEPGRGTSGRPRYTYVANPQLLRADFERLERLLRVDRVAYFVTSSFRTAVPELAANARQVAGDVGFRLEFVDVETSAREAVRRMPEGVEAAYIGVLPRLEQPEVDALISALTERRIPTFAQEGRTLVEAGALAGIAQGIDLPRRARRVALDVQRIALGESGADIPVFITRTRRLVINMETARAIQFWPDWAALTEAELLDRQRSDVDRRLTLQSAAEEALERNLDFLANAESVEAGAKEVARARARLFPQARAELSGSWIDADRTGSLQNQAERQVDLSLNGSQLLYDDAVYADLKIQKYLQESREFDRDTLRLDVLQAATKTYLDVLRTSTLERIQLRNLDLTRSNRELAVVRKAVGVAGPSEVYRWDSQLASDQSALIEAIANRNAAEIALNRLLDRPLEQPFTAAEADMDEPLNLVRGTFWTKALENPFTFKMFRTFMSEVGVEASPALEAVDAGIAATERRIVAANREWWLPQFGLQGRLGYIVAQDGSGSEDFDPNDLPPGLGGAFPVPDDVSWLVGLSASYPLFTGLDRLAEVRRANLELRQQKLERRSVALQVEERIRQALHVAGASYAAIALSRESADAARKNLEVVRDAYAEGTTGYLNLLDAQNQALVADQVAANAVYDFLRDLMDVQRAVSRFLTLEDPAVRAEFERRMLDHFETMGPDVEPSAAGVVPGRR